MYKILSLILITTYIINASLLVVKDKRGNIISTKAIIHSNDNLFLNQDDREWDIGALYKEIFADVIRANRAKEAKDRIIEIKKEIKKAKAKGIKYILTQKQRVKLLEDAKYYKGGKYVWGGTTPNGFDCSGYVQYLYKKQKINLPRTAYSQSKIGKTIPLKDIKKGDLLFFLTDKSRGIPITHVGIYLGNGKFIHAASKKDGIIISPITYGTYRDCFVIAKRLDKKI
ncbi:NLP/P60 family protein [hydrothermal vent metagenome]|uniref:NLP/P60 family protein n=1 Tax=hydrothermal vent metagenome TaxID=652676 RepID=A0A1W1EKS1_9ZZZZ